jgi:hypothetical protein
MQQVIGQTSWLSIHEIPGTAGFWSSLPPHASAGGLLSGPILRHEG